MAGMIPRHLAGVVRSYARGFKIVAILGPRQSGKTTLARALFANKPYVNLEDPDERQFAADDPRGFLARFPKGAVIDEAQHSPPLFSYLQTRVDASPRRGQFVLTGSQQFGLMEHISQTLAGRVGTVDLLPFSYSELRDAGHAAVSVEDALFRGGYPPLFDTPRVAPVRWLNSYLRTYVERDVRQVVNVRPNDRKLLPPQAACQFIGVLERKRPFGERGLPVRAVDHSEPHEPGRMAHRRQDLVHFVDRHLLEDVSLVLCLRLARRHELEAVDPLEGCALDVLAPEVDPRRREEVADLQPRDAAGPDPGRKLAAFAAARVFDPGPAPRG